MGGRSRMPPSTVFFDNGTLLIEEISIGDAGRYTCEADNGIPPSATHSFTVTVNGKTNVPAEFGRLVDVPGFTDVTTPIVSLPCVQHTTANGWGLPATSRPRHYSQLQCSCFSIRLLAHPR